MAMAQLNCNNNLERMEVTECCENVLQAALRYQNDHSLSLHLLHHLEALESSCNKPAKVHQLVSSTDHLQLADCLTFLVNAIRDDEGLLLDNVLKVLLNLSNDETIKVMLHDTFNLCPYLARLIDTRPYQSEDHTLNNILQLLQKLTYGHRVKYDQTYVDNLLKFLVGNVLSKQDSLIEPSLGILNNLCRENKLMQSAVRSLPQFRKLLKYLCSYFEHESQSVLVFSLSIFTCLTLQDREGQTFFLNDGNFERVLQTIFSILKNGFRGGKWKYAADLLMDFVRNVQLQSCIVRYRHLSVCLHSVLTLLASHTEEGVAEVFRLLLSLCSVPSIRKIVNSHLFGPLAKGGSLAQQLSKASPSQPLSPDSEPLACCVHWASCESGQGSHTGSLAMEFLSDSVQECLCDTDNAYPVHILVSVFVSLLSKSVMVSSQISENTFLSLSQKIIQLTQLLKAMTSDSQCKASLGKEQQLSVDTFSAALETHLSNRNLSHGLALSRLHSENAWKDISSRCVLLVLDFALSVRGLVSGLNQYIATVLKDPRLFPFLSQGLMSTDHNLIGIALRLICFDLASEMMQPDVDLCETIACMNKEKAASSPLAMPQKGPLILANITQRSEEDKENQRQRPVSASTPVSHLALSSKGQSWDESKLLKEDLQLSNLIERLETSIDSRDVKTADVIDVFQHRIKSQQIKQEHLNDLLEAKTQALAQADRLIAQLRGRQIAHNAETLKLQRVLKDSDRQNEKVVTEMNAMRISTDKLQAQFEKQLVDEAGRIEKFEKENADLMEKCSELEESVAACKQKISSITQMKDDLQQAHEKLNEQYRVSCNQSQQLNEERKNLSKLVKEKESALQKLTANLESLEEKFRSVSKEKTEMENEKEEVETYVEKLQVQLNASEKECKQLAQRVSMLDKVSQEQSQKLTEKTTRIQELEAELDKHSQIVSFINNLHLKK